MKPERYKMETSDLDRERILVENLYEYKRALNDGKKPEIPPKPIVPQTNLQYKEKTVTKRGLNSGHAADISKQLIEGNLHPSMKHSSFCKNNEEDFQMEVVMCKGGAYSIPSEKTVSKPPLLPKPSPQLLENKLPLCTSTPVQSHSYTTTNIEVEYNNKNNISVSNAANLLEAANTLSATRNAKKADNGSLEDDCCDKYKHEEGNTPVGSGSCPTTSNLFRFSRFNNKCNNTDTQPIVITSLPDLHFKHDQLFINRTNKVILKHYPSVNALCDTFYPADLNSSFVKLGYVSCGKLSNSSCDAGKSIEDSKKDNMSTHNTEISRTLRHSSPALSYDVNCLETSFQNVKICCSGDYSECSLKLKSTNSLCSSHKNNLKCVSNSVSTNVENFKAKNVSSYLNSIETIPFSRHYSQTPCHKSHLVDKLQRQSVDSIYPSTDKTIHKVVSTDMCCKPIRCFECAAGHKSLNCKDGNFSNYFVKVKPDKESGSNSMFYYDCHTSNREGTCGASDLSASDSISEPEQKLQSSHKLKTSDDINRPASGLSGILEFNENSEAPSSEACFSVHDISDSDNDENAVSLDQLVTLTDAERKEKKAFYTVRELVTSEKVFIDVLKLLTEDFRNAVQISEKINKSSIIPEENLFKILNSLPQLLHLNEDLLTDLENRIENWQTVKKVSDVIVKKGPFLKLYSTYIQDFEFQCSYLDECCSKYPKFARVVKEFEASPRCKKLSLKHYMIKPVQRIPQYRLILNDYLSTQNCDSPDYEDTKTALKIVCDVADHANRRLKLGDGLKKLMQLQTMLRNYEIIKPGRDLIKDGELFKLSRKDMQPRYFILLNDCLLCTSYIGSTIHSAESIKVNYHLPMDDLKVFVPKTQAYENEFSIISTRRSFRLSARSSEERDEWVTLLKNTIREYAKRKESFKQKSCDTLISYEESSFPAFHLGKDAPVWVQDFRVTRCQSCTELFTVTFRRHHCRACGKVVCGNCSENRAPLEYKNYRSARVCGDCFESLLREFEQSPLQLKYNELSIIRARFLKKGETSKKKYVPERLLEVTANDTKSQMSGWLQKRSRRSWKRYWFVLKNQVLYVYKASEDVVALESIPVLGYKVMSLKKNVVSSYEGVDKNLVFQLHHVGQTPITFHADSEQMADKWIAALEAQTVF